MAVLDLHFSTCTSGCAGELGRPPWSRRRHPRLAYQLSSREAFSMYHKQDVQRFVSLRTSCAVLWSTTTAVLMGATMSAFLNKIHGTWPGCVPQQTDLKVLPEQVQQCLHAERQKRKAQNLTSWRKRMWICDKECIRWFHDRSPVLPLAVSCTRSARVLVASRTGESLEQNLAAPREA